jgi:hypothetical protein
MAVRMSALSAGRPLPPGRFLVLISVRDWVDPRVIVRLGGLGQLKNPVTSSGIEPATFRLPPSNPLYLLKSEIRANKCSYSVPVSQKTYHVFVTTTDTWLGK